MKTADPTAAIRQNGFVQATDHAKLRGRDDFRAPLLAELVALDDAGFRARFVGSAAKRIGRNRFVRNVLIAIGNSGDPALRPAAAARCADPDPTVSEFSRWALETLQHAAA